VSNAAPHAKKGVVVNVDLEGFFPSITFPRVRGVFASLGYSPCAATLLALLCTEAPRVVVEHAGQRLFVATGERALPQGACTSPALANLVCARLDRRLRGIASHSGVAYTRYADDLTFSAEALSAQKLGHLLVTVDTIAREEGFRVHDRKTRVMRRSARQEVTGIVVNAGARVPREEVRRLRAILHDAKRFGLDEANREKREDFARWLRGKLAYLAMVDPLRGQAMLEELDTIEGR
jgi:retron-type reverse transcriptase